MRRKAVKIRIALLMCLFVSLAWASNPDVHTFEANLSRGFIRYWGNGDVHVEGKGTLTIKNLSVVDSDVKGTLGEQKKIADGVVYTHFEGSCDVKGRGAHVEIRGWNLKIKATGQGKAWIKGEGTWKFDDQSGEWKSDKWKKFTFRSFF